MKLMSSILLTIRGMYVHNRLHVDEFFEISAKTGCGVQSGTSYGQL